MNIYYLIPSILHIIYHLYANIYVFFVRLDRSVHLELLGKQGLENDSMLLKSRIACCKSGTNGAFYSVQTSLYVHGYLVSTLKQNVDYRSDILNTPACHFV